jgi:hypothetical protein
MQHDLTQAMKTPSRTGWWITGVFLAVMVAIAIAPRVYRERHLATLEQNSAPLVQAIRAYARDQGVPPPSLQALVPRYVEQLPETGYRPNPRFSLSRGPGPEWTLEVPTTNWMFEVDTFQYYSRDPRWRLVPANEVR